MGPQCIAAADRRFFLHQIAGVVECMRECRQGKEPGAIAGIHSTPAGQDSQTGLVERLGALGAGGFVVAA
jgi:hypothetical protein